MLDHYQNVLLIYIGGHHHLERPIAHSQECHFVGGVDGSYGGRGYGNKTLQCVHITPNILHVIAKAVVFQYLSRGGVSDVIPHHPTVTRYTFEGFFYCIDVRVPLHLRSRIGTHSEILLKYSAPNEREREKAVLLP
ncbi:dynein-associated protein [Angomonas deanei]|uniref:Uncharacterized protein n=1 Tax=Angomonas deanei TaxID=59799 RepID=A0A7G2C1F5_9TRYP|nr:dynein-associated protein [Angomonas deanei]CAD2213466.1 hypothetical protein, conserved [Angomonas deanei]|eukprot:EPY40548.1 dynein-associated protein [Angomonas deanei]